MKTEAMQEHNDTVLCIMCGFIGGVSKYIYLAVIYGGVQHIVEPVGTAFLCGAAGYVGKKAIEWVVMAWKEFRSNRKKKK